VQRSINATNGNGSTTPASIYMRYESVEIHINSCYRRHQNGQGARPAWPDTSAKLYAVALLMAVPIDSRRAQAQTFSLTGAVLHQRYDTCGGYIRFRAVGINFGMPSRGHRRQTVFESRASRSCALIKDYARRCSALTHSTVTHDMAAPEADDAERSRVLIACITVTVGADTTGEIYQIIIATIIPRTCRAIVWFGVQAVREFAQQPQLQGLRNTGWCRRTQ